jgi:hypothetical protein
MRVRIWRFIVLLLLLPVAPAVAAACSGVKASSETVGSSQNAAVTDASNWSQTYSGMTQALNPVTAAGTYNNSNGLAVAHQLTIFNGAFSTASPGIVTRDINAGMGAIVPVTTSNWGAITLGDGNPAGSYQYPAATVYAGQTGTWLAASQAWSTAKGTTSYDIALAVTTNGGTGWQDVYSLSKMIGYDAGFNTIGDIEIAVDPWTKYYSSGFENYKGQSSVSGNYNTIYVYYTVNNGTYLTGQFTVFWIDSAGHLFLTTALLNDGNGNCTPFTTQLSCQDSAYVGNTMNFVVGHQTNASCSPAGSTTQDEQTFLFVEWATTNPYGQTDNNGCGGGGTFTQTWMASVLWDPLQQGATTYWSGNGNSASSNAATEITSDWASETRHCIGDQTNWPRPALAFDPVDYSVAQAWSIFCPSSLCTTTGNRIGSLQTIPMGCATDAGTGFGSEGSGHSPTPCLNPNTLAPCTCGSTGCGTMSPTYEIDQILPELAYDSNNDLALTYYDNTGRGSGNNVSAFGDVLAQAAAGTNGHLLSNLQPGFQLIEPFSQEVDASAVAQKRIGLSPTGGYPQFFGASIGHASVFNQQFNSQ